MSLPFTLKSLASFDYTTSTLSSLPTETSSNRSKLLHLKSCDLSVTLSTSHFPISNLGFTLSDALLNLSLSLFRSFAAELAEVKAKLREAEDELVKALAGTHSYISVFFVFFFNFNFYIVLVCCCVLLSCS